MSNAALDRLIWVLIYGGLLVACLSLFVARQRSSLAWPMGIVGALVAVIGAILVFVRARRRDPSRA